MDILLKQVYASTWAPVIFTTPVVSAGPVWPCVGSIGFGVWESGLFDG